MATPNAQIRLSGLARRLVQDELLSEDDAEQAHEKALKDKVPFVAYLVDQKLASSADIAWSASQEFGIPLFDIACMDLDMAPVSLVAEKLVHKHNALPLFKRGGRLYVAVSDPTNLQSLV